MAICKVVTKYTYKWKIDNFKQRISGVKFSSSIFSDVFSLNDKSNSKFLMRLQRRTDYDFDIYLVHKEIGRSRKIQLKIKSWRENFEGKIEAVNDKKVIFNETQHTVRIDEYYASRITSLAVNDILFICCEIEHEESIDEVNELDESDSDDEVNSRDEIGRNLLQLHSAGHFDLTIHAEEKEFKASKLTLMSCSKIFQTMLSMPNSTEAQMGIINIQGMTAKAIEAMIHWIYQIKIDNMNEIVEDLYRAADKYGIVLLKKKCVKEMAKSLSPKNLPVRLILTYRHNEEKLKTCILDYLREDYKNVQYLMPSKEWIKFSSNETEFAQKIVSDIYA